MKLTARQVERLVKQGEVVHTECKDASGGLPDVLPDFFLDYREKLSTDTRWTDRVAAHDATWSGNIYDFYMMIYDRITSHVKMPFELDADGLRVEENEIHKSLRELLANALIHADYHGRRGIVIEKQAQTIIFSNPGIFRVNKAVAVEGGTSDARNSHIFNIFALVDIGERSGTGLADLYGHWKKYNFPDPTIAEEYDPDRVKVTVYTDSDQDPTKTRPSPDQSAQGSPKVPQECPKGAPRVPQEIGDAPSSVKQVYLAMHEDVAITHRGLESKLGLSKTTIRKATATLIQRGLIRRVGPRFGGHWEVVK